MAIHGRLGPPGRLASRLAGMILVTLTLGGGCDSSGTGSAGAWNKTGNKGGERWTINCLRSIAPNHAEVCNQLAEMLRRVDGLNPREVRVQSDAGGSTLYYGEYARVAGSSGEDLVFPPKMHQDMKRIRSLALHQTTPFALAAPELMSGGTSSAQDEYHLSKAFNAKGDRTLSLLVAIFYNMPGFNQRKEAAEQYVQQLRKEGVEAYIFHEAMKSYVFVGTFEESQFLRLPGGAWDYGQKVKNLIDSRPDDEFRYVTENGYRQKAIGPNGVALFATSQLVPVPAPGATGLWEDR